MRSPSEVIRAYLKSQEGVTINHVRPDYVEDTVEYIIKNLEAEGYFIGALSPTDSRQIERLAKNPVAQPLVVNAYFDGNGNAINGKPGKAQWLVELSNGITIPGLKTFEGKTNNELEFLGLLECVKELVGAGLRDCKITIHGDSRNVICWMDGTYRCKEERLIRIKNEVIQQLSLLKVTNKDVSIVWVPSDQNKVDGHPQRKKDVI